jgi:putative ABC transport system substrate-binding protein
VGLLSGNRFDDRELDAIRNGLREVGYNEGKDVAIEYRSAEGRYDRLASLAEELVRHPVTLLAAIGGTVSAVAAKTATATIPIVFMNGGDPVRAGLVTSLNRPGANVTGVSFFVTTLGAKRLELLRQLMPTVTTFGYLANRANANFELERADIEAAARALNLHVRVQWASSERDFVAAFDNFSAQKAGAIIVSADAFFLSQRAELAAFGLRHRLPLMCDVREHAVAGSMMSYGTDRIGAYRQGGIYIGKILQGDRPADLPIMQSTKFEFVINLKTANALGIAVPQSLLEQIPVDFTHSQRA